MALLEYRARSARATFAWLVFVPLVAGCGAGNLASQLAEAPSFEPSGQTKCQVQKSHDRPLIVEWPAAERADLETLARRGLIAVRYPGCDMRVLRQCRVSGRYAYAGITRKEERVAIRTADELYAAMPLSALRLESKLAKNGELDVAMTIVGKLEAPASGAAPVLSGDCTGVTHLVTAITVGAFEFSSGAGADVGAEASFLAAGAGAKSSARRELLNRDGDAAACARSGASDAAPPDGCGAFLRLEVEPVTPRGAADASAPRSASALEPPPEAEPGPTPQATPIAATAASPGRPFAPGPSAGGGGALGPFVVARDGTGNLWLHDERPDAEPARAWRSLGRTATSATLVGGARPLVVARGADGTLAARPLAGAATGGASDWRPLGPLGTDAPRAIALGPGGAASALGRARDGSRVGRGR
ncbi:MAG: hypothetical protein HY908_19795, partial [Myxococcales bacterium]|nr:hypothetical protein [Myxococcales bacterium]